MPRRVLQLEEPPIVYEECGHGFPIIGIHGYYPDRRLMIGALEPLFDDEDRVLLPASAGCGRPSGGPSGRSYRRIYLDLPFMGASGDPEWVRTSDDMLRLVTDFIQAVLPAGPFLVAGESYGGYLARGLARTFGARVEGLLLLCPMILARAEDRTVPGHQAMRVESGYADGRAPGDVEEFESFTVIRDCFTWERSWAEIMPGVRSARRESLEALRQAGYGFACDSLGPLGVSGTQDQPFDDPFERPVVFFLGRQDASVGWQDALRLAERYPRASFAILDMAGHNLQIEQAGLFSALACEWLGRCEDFPNTCSGTPS